MSDQEDLSEKRVVLDGNMFQRVEFVDLNAYASIHGYIQASDGEGYITSPVFGLEDAIWLRDKLNAWIEARQKRFPEKTNVAP